MAGIKKYMQKNTTIYKNTFC